VKHWRPFAGVLLILTILLAACGGSDPQSASSDLRGINVGNKALDFTLSSLDGDEFSLSDYQGDVVLVNFWATWCAPCQAEIPDFEAVYRSHKDRGFVILGVNQQEAPQVIEPFVAELEMTYPVLLDPRGDLMKDYRILGMPTSLLIDREGVIQLRHTGIMTASELENALAEHLMD
jgi:cytochrome c biogenesis protein CcmG/thiol:disulfide interchange protein DsbE